MAHEKTGSCPDCKTPISYNAVRCRPCATRHANAIRLIASMKHKILRTQSAAVWPKTAWFK